MFLSVQTFLSWFLKSFKVLAISHLVLQLSLLYTLLLIYNQSKATNLIIHLEKFSHNSLKLLLISFKTSSLHHIHSHYSCWKQSNASIPTSIITTKSQLQSLTILLPYIIVDPILTSQLTIFTTKTNHNSFPKCFSHSAIMSSEALMISFHYNSIYISYYSNNRPHNQNKSPIWLNTNPNQ